VLAARQLYS